MKELPEQIDCNFTGAKYFLSGPRGCRKWIMRRSRSDASNESCSFWKCFIAERCLPSGYHEKKKKWTAEIHSVPHLDQEVNALIIRILVVLFINNGSLSWHLNLIYDESSTAQLLSHANDMWHNLNGFFLNLTHFLSSVESFHGSWSQSAEEGCEKAQKETLNAPEELFNKTSLMSDFVQMHRQQTANTLNSENRQRQHIMTVTDGIQTVQNSF